MLPVGEWGIRVGMGAFPSTALVYKLFSAHRVGLQPCEELRAACVWEDVVYNFARPVKTLRQEIDTDAKRWRQQSPAMAAGLTHHIWSIRELLMRVPVTTHSI